MNEKEILEGLRDAIVKLDFDEIQNYSKKVIELKISPIKAIKEGMAKGMDIIGKKFEKGEVFLSELIVASEVMKEGLKILEPHFKKEDVVSKGKVVIGTVQGDLHDIGKNLVSSLLSSSGFEVIDLGIDVSKERFVQAVKEHNPKIVGMSALLTTTMNEMKNVIDELKKEGLRDLIKVIIGGAPITKEFGEKIGADYATKDAVDGVRKCNDWFGVK
jgi:5-methyltetrahydrofolate--homocysteine methyltransferase